MTFMRLTAKIIASIYFSEFIYFVTIKFRLRQALLQKRFKKGKRKVQGVPQSQTAALPRPQEDKKTDKSKQAQIEQTYEKL